MNGIEHSITFSARIEAKFPHSIRVVGSSSHLGNWNPEEGLLLQTSEIAYPYWCSHANIRVPANFYLEFKLIQVSQDNSVKWEPGQNRKAHITGDLLISCTWGEPSLKTQSSQQLLREKKKSEQLFEIDNHDDSIRFSLKSDDSFANTNSLLILKSRFQLNSKLQVFSLQGRGKTYSVSTIQENQLSQTITQNQEALLFTDDLNILRRLRQQKDKNICLLFKGSSQDNFKQMLQCHSIIFSNFQMLEAYQEYLKQRSISLIKFMNTRIAIGYKILQILQICATPLPTVLNQVCAQVIACLTRAILLGRKYLNQSILFSQRSLQRLKQDDYLVLINANIIKRYELFDKLISQYPNICIATESEIEPDLINPQVLQRISIINLKQRCFQPAKRYKWKWYFPPELQSLPEIQKTIKNIGFRNLLSLKRITKQCLEVSANCPRLSQMMLHFIQKEIRQRPDYQTLEIFMSRNRMYIHRLSFICWIDELSKYRKTCGIIVVGPPIYPEILGFGRNVHYIDSLERLLTFKEQENVK